LLLCHELKAGRGVQTVVTMADKRALTSINSLSHHLRNILICSENCVEKQGGSSTIKSELSS